MWKNKTRLITIAAIAAVAGISLAGCATEPGQGERFDEDLKQVRDVGVAGTERQSGREQIPDPVRARAEMAMRDALTVMRDADKLADEQVV